MIDVRKITQLEATFREEAILLPQVEAQHQDNCTFSSLSLEGSKEISIERQNGDRQKERVKM